MTKANVLTANIPPDYAGRRLDLALAALFPEHTRSQLQKWIKEGRVAVLPGVVAARSHAGLATVARDKVAGGETVEIHIPPPVDHGWRAQSIPLVVVYEDEHLLVVNKPAGLVVHPGAGNPEGTLLNALLHHAATLAHLPRAGIVHRLDKDTSGLLVIAKTETTRQSLIAQLQERSLEREYIAIVSGVLIAGGTVEAPIARHRRDRTRMAVSDTGREAVSHYRVLKKYRAHTLLQVNLESGRTHQIRVHMAHLRFPVLGDPVYGGRLQIPRGASEPLIAMLQGFKRQALHAARLALIHPDTDKRMQWAASVPDDMGKLMEALAQDARSYSIKR